MLTYRRDPKVYHGGFQFLSHFRVFSGTGKISKTFALTWYFWSYLKNHILHKIVLFLWKSILQCYNVVKQNKVEKYDSTCITYLKLFWCSLIYIFSNYFIGGKGIFGKYMYLLKIDDEIFNYNSPSVLYEWNKSPRLLYYQFNSMYVFMLYNYILCIKYLNIILNIPWDNNNRCWRHLFRNLWKFVFVKMPVVVTFQSKFYPVCKELEKTMFLL